MFTGIIQGAVLTSHSDENVMSGKEIPSEDIIAVENEANSNVPRTNGNFDIGWTWMSGDNAVTQHGVYGTKGVPAASNKPGCREMAVSWTDADGNLWLFGGEGLHSSPIFWGYLNDLWRYNISDGLWTWMSGDNAVNQHGVYGTKGAPAASNKPGSRNFAISWTDADGNLWFFGGKGYNSSNLGYLNDLWRYNVSNGLWTWMSGDNAVNQHGVYGTKGTPEASNKPGSRGDAVSWTDTDGNLWLFGGYGYNSSDSGTLNDLWRYNVSNGRWTWMSGDNAVNQHGVYGTKGTPEASNKPGSRSGVISWTDADGNLWLFGGDGYDSSNLGTLNDLWMYNVSDGRWTWMSGDNAVNQYGVYGTKGTPEASNKPGSRGNAVSWTDADGNLWLFGGHGYNSSDSGGTLNDIWRYNVSDGRWTWMSGEDALNQHGVYGTKGTLAASNKPGSRYGAVSWTDADGNLWLFGGHGYDSSDSGTLNDLWKVENDIQEQYSPDFTEFFKRMVERGFKQRFKERMWEVILEKLFEKTRLTPGEVKAFLD